MSCSRVTQAIFLLISSALFSCWAVMKGLRDKCSDCRRVARVPSLPWAPPSPTMRSCVDPAAGVIPIFWDYLGWNGLCWAAAAAECALLRGGCTTSTVWCLPFPAANLRFPSLGQECSGSEHPPSWISTSRTSWMEFSCIQGHCHEFLCLMETSRLSPHTAPVTPIMDLPQGCSQSLFSAPPSSPATLALHCLPAHLNSAVRFVPEPLLCSV